MYALLWFYGQERALQRMRQIRNLPPLWGGTIIADPKTRKQYFTSSLNNKMCLFC